MRDTLKSCKGTAVARRNPKAGNGQVNPEAELDKVQQKKFAGCLLEGTGINGEHAEDQGCRQGEFVNWEAQCNSLCDVCKDCARWWMTPDEDDIGGYRCWLHKRNVLYMKWPNAVAVAGADVCSPNSECWWEGELLLRCGGDMGETGLKSKGKCKEACCNDASCTVWQWNAQLELCQLGRSWTCDGASGWEGQRKAKTAREMFKQMCDNAARAKSLAEDGKAVLEPEDQAALELSQSSCFQKTCDVNSQELTGCSERELEEIQAKIKQSSCDQLPEWELGNWSSCSAQRLASIFCK